MLPQLYVLSTLMYIKGNLTGLPKVDEVHQYNCIILNI